ncbi:MAG: hypothetical protein WDZ85_01600 [Candidatus Paceibacterota bacterium]
MSNNIIPGIDFSGVSVACPTGGRIEREKVVAYFRRHYPISQKEALTWAESLDSALEDHWQRMGSLRS